MLVLDYLLVFTLSNNPMPRIFYKEMWVFRCESDQDTITYDPNTIIRPNAGMVKLWSDSAIYDEINIDKMIKALKLARDAGFYKVEDFIYESEELNDGHIKRYRIIKSIPGVQYYPVIHLGKPVILKSNNSLNYDSVKTQTHLSFIFWMFPLASTPQSSRSQVPVFRDPASVGRRVARRVFRSPLNRIKIICRNSQKHELLSYV